MKRAVGVFADKKLIFLICSNESQDLKKFKDINYIWGNNHELEDMYLLANCDYIIGPPSTYLLSASFYNQVPIYTICDKNRNFTLQDFTPLLNMGKMCMSKYCQDRV